MSFTYINELLSSPSTSELFSNPSYPLYLSVETLTKAAEKQRSSKRAPYSIPRPPNPFFIFRKNYTAKMKQEAERSSTTDTSKNVGKIWKEQGPKVKKLFQALSLLAKKNHNLKYPDYKYQPKSKTLKQLTFCHVDPGTGNSKNKYKNNKKDKKKEKNNKKDWDNNNENNENNEEDEDNEEGGRFSSIIVLEETKKINYNNSASETFLIQNFNSFQLFYPCTTTTTTINSITNISNSTMHNAYLCSPPSFYSELNNCSDDFVSEFFSNRNNS